MNMIDEEGVLKAAVFRDRVYDKTHSYEAGIALTQEPCILTYTPTRTTYRGIMSCGHSIDPNNLYSYLFHEVINGEWQIKCPFVSKVNPHDRCGKLWGYEELRKMAMLNNHEKDFFEIHMSRNHIDSLKDVQECEKCSYYVKKLGFTKRIICQSCLADGKPPEVTCFNCKKEWKNIRKNKCDNELCEAKLKCFIQEMPKKLIIGNLVDQIQECPNCETLIEHIGTEYCRIIRCPCKHKFCFICRKFGKETEFSTCRGTVGGCK